MKEKITRRRFLEKIGWYAFASFNLNLLFRLTGYAQYLGSQKQKYIAADPKKCQGCLNCMLACSLVHTGEQNLNLAGIKIIQNPFGHFPADIRIITCRQCADAPCAAVCPVDAFCFNDNIWSVNAEKCLGCHSCANACVCQPSSISFSPATTKAFKCDFCLSVPYLEKKQACLEVCPVQALAIVSEKDYLTYEDVNLRDFFWWLLGYPVN